MDVVHTHQWNIQREGQSLRAARPDEQGADQTRTMTNRDGVEIRKRDPGLSDGAADHGKQML